MLAVSVGPVVQIILLLLLLLDTVVDGKLTGAEVMIVVLVPPLAAIKLVKVLVLIVGEVLTVEVLAEGVLVEDRLSLGGFGKNCIQI